MKVIKINFNDFLIQNNKERFSVDNINFDGFIFPMDVNFEDLDISNFVWIKNSFFLGCVEFSSCNFKNGILITNTIFFDFSNFSSLNGKVDLNIRRCIFYNSCYLSDNIEYYQLRFDQTIFSWPMEIDEIKHLTSVEFSNNVFTQNFNFLNVTVDNAAKFHHNYFLKESDFSGTHFKGAAILDNCKFENINDFNDDTLPKFFLESFDPKLVHKYNPDLIADDINVIPNLTSTIFTIPPNLSYTYIQSELELKWWQKFYNVPPKSTHELSAAKYRRLKELAKAGENHFEEAKFFRHEMLARRNHEVKGFQSFLINLYEYFSKCGLSFLRPLISLIVITLLFFALFLHYQSSGMASIHGGTYLDFLKYSFHNAIPIIGATVPERAVVINTLFGGYENRPTFYGFLAVVQNLISIGFEFLMLLAVRNYFKMR